MTGIIIPAVLLIILGIVYSTTGGHSNMNLHSSFLPDPTNFDNVVLVASIFLFYAEVEMGGIHMKDIDSPSKGCSEMVSIGALTVVITFILDTFSLGVTIPAKNTNLA